VRGVVNSSPSPIAEIAIKPTPVVKPSTPTEFKFTFPQGEDDEDEEEDNIVAAKLQEMSKSAKQRLEGTMPAVLGKRVGEPRVDIFDLKRYPSEIIEDPRIQELAVPSEVELQQPPQILVQSLADNKQQNEE